MTRMEFTISANQSSFQLDWLLRRIAAIVSGKEDIVPVNGTTATWSLDPAGNDWFATFEDARLVVSYRYTVVPEQLSALRCVILMFCSDGMQLSAKG